jgi:hypothetical protein
MIENLFAEHAMLIGVIIGFVVGYIFGRASS